MKNNPIRLFLIFLFSMVVFLQATEIYPEWFLFPKRYPKIITGYTYNGMTANSDAANMYLAYRECIVVGTLEILEDEANTDMLKNSNYFYYFSADSIETLRERLKPSDRFDVNIFTHDQIYAFALDNALDLNSERIDSNTLPEPDWKNKNFFEDNKYYYGVGMYTAIGLENDAWKTAEEQAVFTILTALAVNVYKIQITEKENGIGEDVSSFDQISFIKLKFLLKNITVLERFPDRKNKLFYALVRIPKKGIISPMLK